MTPKFPSFEKKGPIIFGTTIGLSAKALLRGQLRWFQERGWDVTLVSSPDNDAHDTATREGIPLVGVDMERDIDIISDVKAAVRWIRTIRSIQPRVVNVGTPKASLLGMFAAWVTRVPRRIYTVRGLRLEGTSGSLRRLLWLVERFTIAMATDVVAISPSLGKELVGRRLISARDVWLIGDGSSNGADAPAIQRRIQEIDRYTLRTELGLESAKFVVGYIGRVTPAKGVDTLIRAMQSKQLDDGVHLLVVGSIEDAELGKIVSTYDEKIHTVAWSDDVWKYLPAIDTLCLPTLREGFGNVVIEAAAAGVPSITTRATGAIDTVIDDETGYLIDVGDSQALVERINLLANDPDLVYTLGKNAQTRTEQHFIPQTIWHGIESIAEGRRDGEQVLRLDHYLKNRGWV